MQATIIPKDYEHTSPAGAWVSVLMSNAHGGIAHCTLKDKIISKAVRHKTVSEFWRIYPVVALFGAGVMGKRR